MSDEHTPSVELALSLSSPFPRSPAPGHEGSSAPTALPEPDVSERHSHVEPGLGRVEELYQRFSVGDDITVQAHWLLDSPAEAARPQHLLHVELGVDGESVRVRRGQMDSMRKALELADYLFATIDREELGRRTC